MPKVKFMADKIKLTGAMSDGSYKVELWTGEYEKGKLKDLLDIPEMTPLKVIIKYG